MIGDLKYLELQNIFKKKIPETRTVTRPRYRACNLSLSFHPINLVTICSRYQHKSYSHLDGSLIETDVVNRIHRRYSSPDSAVQVDEKPIMHVSD